LLERPGASAVLLGPNLADGGRLDRSAEGAVTIGFAGVVKSIVERAAAKPVDHWTNL
jgi:hypothetical protein